MEEPPPPEWLTRLLPILNSYELSKEDLNIVVCGCQDSGVPKTLYGLGYLKITYFDNNEKTFVRDMLMSNTETPKLKWRLLDGLTRVNSEVKSESIDVAVDKGSLDALGSLHAARTYLYKFETSLKVGGRFICFTRCSPEVVESLLRVFHTGYKMTFQILEEDAMTIVAVEKVHTALPHVIPDFDGNAILGEAIRKENAKRFASHCSLGISLSDVTVGVIGDPKVIHVGRKYKISGYRPPDGCTYDILVLDVDMSEGDSYSYEVFFTKGMKLLFPSEEQWAMIASHAQAARVYVVLINDAAEYLDLSNLEKDLEAVFKELSPRVIGKNHRARKFSEDELLKFFQRVEESSSESQGGDIRGSLLTKCPHITTGEYFIRDPCAELKQCVGGYSVEVGSAGIFHLDRKNAISNVLLVEEKYDETLTEWLLKNPEKVDRWREKNEVWNSQQFRECYKLDKIDGWDASRPTDKVCQIINGVICATLDLNFRRLIYGNLSNTDSYLLRWETVTENGLTCHKVKVRLDPTLAHPEVSSFSRDVKDIYDLIFQKVLMGKSLPRLWSNLQLSLLEFGGLEEDAMFGEDGEVQRKILKDHPCCWFWQKRCDYFDIIWMRIHQTKRVNLDAQVISLMKILRGDGDDNSKDDDGTFDWKYLVPENTPIHRVLEARKRTINLANSNFELQRLNHGVFLHLFDEMVTKDKNDKEGSENSMKYVKSDEEEEGSEKPMKYVKSGEEAYEDIEFVEVVMAEIFPDFLTDTVQRIVHYQIQL